VVDHGVERWGKTINNQNSRNEYIKVREDTGSVVNWIAPQQVDKLAAPVCDIESPREYKSIQGMVFKPTQETTLTLTGQTRKSSQDVFLIAPDQFPIDGVVVGTEFIKRWGHVHVLFGDVKEKEPEQAMLVVQNKISVGMRDHAFELYSLVANALISKLRALLLPNGEQRLRRRLLSWQIDVR
jgi:hypothetical protein